MLKLWLCPEDPGPKYFSNNSAKHQRFSKKSSYDTMPNTSVHKISPRQISPAISNGSGFTSNGGFHIPLTMCEIPHSNSGSSERSSQDVSYHLANPQIMKQPTKQAPRHNVPPLYFSQTTGQKPMGISPRGPPRAQVISPKEKVNYMSNHDSESIWSPEARQGGRDYHSP